MTDTFTFITRIDKKVVPYLRTAAARLDLQFAQREDGTIVFDSGKICEKVVLEALALATKAIGNPSLKTAIEASLKREGIE